jgi:hypothetical protein
MLKNNKQSLEFSKNNLTLNLKALFMSKINPIQDLQEIRKMMEGSSKFISLSGLSGVWAGLMALIGGSVAYLLLVRFNKLAEHYYFSGKLETKVLELELQLFLIAGLVLFLALGGGMLITAYKAKKEGQALWSPVSWRLIRSLITPLTFAGIFILGLYARGYYDMIPPAMLIFYGMALLNASKYVHVDIKYLALCEMALGAILVFYPGYGLYYWMFGFGVLHIIYGTIMWWKYDKNKV